MLLNFNDNDLITIFYLIFQASASNSYVFEYTTKAEDNLVTHSRKETADEYGVVRGVYEILEPNCVIRRIEYQADHRHGFQILGITQRSCQEAKQKFHPTVATSGFIPPPPPPKTTPEGRTQKLRSTTIDEAICLSHQNTNQNS